MSLQSARVMVDGALTVVSKKNLSLYAIGGIGNAWNLLSYKDADNSNAADCPNQGLNLGRKTTSNFAWEVGGGLTFSIHPRVLFSFEYLYADLGQAKTSSSGNTGTIAIPKITPAQLDLDSQALLFGLHVTL
jgi:opacity protein-like surface antigen